jgi:hypothetical protein
MLNCIYISSKVYLFVKSSLFHNNIYHCLVLFSLKAKVIIKIVLLMILKVRCDTLFDGII